MTEAKSQSNSIFSHDSEAGASARYDTKFTSAGHPDPRTESFRCRGQGSFSSAPGTYPRLRLWHNNLDHEVSVGSKTFNPPVNGMSLNMERPGRATIRAAAL